LLSLAKIPSNFRINGLPGTCNVVASVNLTPKALTKHKSECRENRIQATLPQSDYVSVADGSLRTPLLLATTSVYRLLAAGAV
jgi:hypothetical protein